jgi:Flp pilus assembly protein TadB
MEELEQTLESVVTSCSAAETRAAVAERELAAVTAKLAKSEEMLAEAARRVRRCIVPVCVFCVIVCVCVAVRRVLLSALSARVVRVTACSLVLYGRRCARARRA